MVTEQVYRSGDVHGGIPYRGGVLISGVSILGFGKPLKREPAAPGYVTTISKEHGRTKLIQLLHSSPFQLDLIFLI